MTPVIKYHIAKDGLKIPYIVLNSLQEQQTFWEAEYARWKANNSMIDRNNIELFDSSQYKTGGGGESWFGKKFYSDEELQNHSVFTFLKEFKVLQKEIGSKIEKILNQIQENLLPKKKKMYNSMGLGIFDFSRASLGLIRQRNNGVKPIDLVIQKAEIELDLPLTHSDPLTKIVTNVKDVYAYTFDAKKSQSFRFFIHIGGNSSVKAEEMMWVGMLLNTIVDFLDKQNISYEINAIIASAERRKGSVNVAYTSACVVCLKSFEQSLDLNGLLLVTSDPAYFRYKGFKQLVMNYGYLNKVACDVGLGSTSDLKKYMPDFANSFKTKDSDVLFVPSVYSESECLRLAKNILNNISDKLKNNQDES